VGNYVVFQRPDGTEQIFKLFGVKRVEHGALERATAVLRLQVRRARRSRTCRCVCVRVGVRSAKPSHSQLRMCVQHVLAAPDAVAGDVILQVQNVFHWHAVSNGVFGTVRAARRAVAIFVYTCAWRGRSIVAYPAYFSARTTSIAASAACRGVRSSGT